MSTQLLIYERAVPISKARHGAMSVKTGDSYDYAAKVNSVPLMATEFAVAAGEYPVVFAGGDDRVMPCVILGARGDQNLFVTKDGGWDAKYIPAFIRQYPFVFASDAKGETLTLCIDEEFKGVNTDGRGERLFDADGNRTSYLEGMLAFSREYQAQFRRSEALCAKLKELDLLEPMRARFRTPAGETMELTGFLAVSRQKLKALDAETLKGLIGSDMMELIYIHLQSLRHFQALVGRIGATPQGEAAAEGEASAPEAETVG